ncbi:hypothetical protein [Haloarcula salina]|uniref:Ig-like domain repeat protein n=1 Tax=Haloarcula salina TaxID=1429914 RepID=A0AA41G352_9EURY|nr:hypothetical protein [Haloarcula salina]MBV0903300.1 hypothetical protein [Haloarcula salina]
MDRLQSLRVGAVVLGLFLVAGAVPASAAPAVLTGSQAQTATPTDTTLAVQGPTGPVSYANPGTVRGTLQTTDGAPVANRQIRLRFENRSRLVTTAANGSFAFEYRPQSTRLGSQPVEVAYVPAQSSPYRGATATFTAEVQQTTPTLTVERSPASVGYGDQLTVRTAVTADGTGVASVPVELRINGTLFKRVLTGTEGTVSTSIRLPADVPAGERSIVAVIPYEDRAIAGRSATVPVTVERRPSTLSADATAENGAVVATGRLATENGRAVRNQPIQVTLDGGAETVVATGRNGTFRARLSTEDVPADTDSATVTARYAAASSNLGTSNASATVPIAGGGAAAPDSADGPLGSVTALVAQLRARLTIPVIAALLTGLGLLVLDITVRRLGLFSDTSAESDASASATTTETTASEPVDESTADATGDSTPSAGEGRADESIQSDVSVVTDISQVSADASTTSEPRGAEPREGSEGAESTDYSGVLGNPYGAVAERSDVTVVSDPAEVSDQAAVTDSNASRSRTVGDRIEAAMADDEFETAITLAYEAIHDELTENWGLRENATHWELVEWCRERDFDESEVDAIETVVEAFDRAAFSVAPAEREHAEIAIESARRVRLDGA